MVLLPFFAALVALLAFLAGFEPVSSSFLAALGAATPFSAALVALSLVASSATSSFGRGLARLRSSAPLVASLLLWVALAPLASAASWSPDLCVRPAGVGNGNGGNPFTVLGPAGTSVSTLRLYRNNGAEGYLRGLVAVFTDGTEVHAGVRKDQYSEITFGEGETITGMTLWAMTPASKKATPRAGRIDLTTNQRSWGYGVDNTAKLSSKAVNVASGVLVGFQGRAGDDMDQVAPIFLKTLSNSVVDNVVFERTPGNDGLVLETLKEGSSVWQGTDYSFSFSGSVARDASTTFSSGTSNGLSLKTTFKASLPKVLESGIEAGWSFGGTSSHEQHSGRSAQLSWSTTVALSAKTPAVFCSAMVWRGQINLRWSGVQTVSAGGASSSFPTSGVLTHVDYGKVETVCRPMAAPASSSTSSAAAAKVAKRWAA